jgi:hypothetical protein
MNHSADKQYAGFSKYLLNGFLLLLPVMFWDGLFTDKLPAAFQPAIFWQDIPPAVQWGEYVFRISLFALAAMMRIDYRSAAQRKGLIVYSTGLLLYFTSWLLLMYAPGGAWSNSLPGFLSPAFTPAIWLSGILMMTNGFYFRFPAGKWCFLVTTCGFLLCHNLHALIVYNRLHP